MEEDVSPSMGPTIHPPTHLYTPWGSPNPPPIHLSHGVYPSIHPSIHLPIYTPHGVHLTIHPSIYPMGSTHPSIHPPTHLYTPWGPPNHPPTPMGSTHPSIHLPIPSTWCPPIFHEVSPLYLTIQCGIIYPSGGPLSTNSALPGNYYCFIIIIISVLVWTLMLKLLWRRDLVWRGRKRRKWISAWHP